MPWCKFFVPKIASPDIRPGDPDLNENIEYAKCIKGHVLKDANDWILCENLPAPDAKCWQEGGETVFSLLTKKRREEQAGGTGEQELSDNAAVQHTRS
ncbi:MAG: hypothetical protein ABI456_12145 [Ktedonobacteraceae bacterium]|nr:hypothetical protein [Chloroflexota bacterium]